jgi:uncharacterized protein (TIGR03083 family)
MSFRDAYERAHDRICNLVDDEVANVEVPTCPGWSVKDVIAHLVGFFTAYREGDPKEAFSQGWADAQVTNRKGRSLGDCLTEWSELLNDPGDLFESHLALVAVSDVLAHEQDLRTALNRPGARDDENIVPAVEMGLSFVDKKVQAEKLPALRIVTEEIDRSMGQGQPSAQLRTTTFDLFRTLHGRRTVDQVRAMDWNGDPQPWMHALFVFGPTQTEVEQ